MLLLALAACLDVSLTKIDDSQPVVSDSAGDTGSAPDTAVDTDTGDPPPDDTADTTLPGDSADTAAPVDTAVDTGPPPDTGEEPDEPPPAISLTCYCDSGYPYTAWSDAAATEPELHVIGMYESQYGYPGPAEVAVRRSADMVLVLTSYAGVDWQVDLEAVHGVSEIVVSYYDASTVTFVGAGTAPVTLVGWIGACAYEIPDLDPTSGCETPDLQAAAERYTGLAMASFQGCYAGGAFLVE